MCPWLWGYEDKNKTKTKQPKYPIPVSNKLPQSNRKTWKVVVN